MPSDAVKMRQPKAKKAKKTSEQDCSLSEQLTSDSQNIVIVEETEKVNDAPHQKKKKSIKRALSKESSSELLESSLMDQENKTLVCTSQSDKVKGKFASDSNLVAESVKPKLKKRKLDSYAPDTQVSEVVSSSTDTGICKADSKMLSKKGKKIAKKSNAASCDDSGAPSQSSEIIESAKDAKNVEMKTVKKKKKKKSGKSEDSSVQDEQSPKKADSSAAYHAIEYLRQWKNNRSEWSFQKVRQVWLLQNMYDVNLVAADDFDILLDYLENLAGKARQSTVDHAEQMCRENEDDEDNAGAGNNQKLSDEQLDRLRRVLQILS